MSKNNKTQITSGNGFQVVVGAIFADACNQLPKEIKPKVLKAQNQIFNALSANGFNYEKLQVFDDDIYSCRVDDDYIVNDKTILTLLKKPYYEQNQP